MRDAASAPALDTVVLLGLVVPFGLAAALVEGPASSSAGAAVPATTVSDALAVLDGAGLLERYAADAVAGDASGLRAHLARLLPAGAGWELHLDNGVASRTLAAEGTRTSGATTAETILVADWSRNVVFPRAECVPGTRGSELETVVLPVRNGRATTDAVATAAFANGHSEAAAPSGSFLVAVAPPALPDASGFAVPYDLTDAAAHARSIAAARDAPAAVRTVSVGGAEADYRVHPSCDAEAVHRFFDGPPRVSGPAVAVPGERLRFELAYGTLARPGALPWSVEASVEEPVAGATVATATLASADATFEWDVPRDALYGTYVLRIRLQAGDQTVHDALPVEVVPPQAREPTIPIHRVGLSVWVEGFQ